MPCAEQQPLTRGTTCSLLLCVHPVRQLLVRYHAAHGCGLVSQHRVLTWAGKLQAQDVLKGGAAAWRGGAAQARTVSASFA